MTAIETRFLGPTNHHWIRYKAIGSGSNMPGHAPLTAVTLDQDDSLDPEANHDRAARALIVKLGWTAAEGYGPWYRGGTANGYVYVCANDRDQLDMKGDAK